MIDIKYTYTSDFTRWALAHDFAAKVVGVIGYSKIFKQKLDIIQISLEEVDGHPPGDFAFMPLIRFGTLQKIPPEMASHIMKIFLARHASELIQARGYYRPREFFERHCWPQVKDKAKTWGFFPEAGLEARNGNVEIPEAVYELFMETINDVMKHWPLITGVANRLINTPVIQGQELEELIANISRKFDQYGHVDDPGWFSLN